MGTSYPTIQPTRTSTLVCEAAKPAPVSCGPLVLRSSGPITTDCERSEVSHVLKANRSHHPQYITNMYRRTTLHAAPRRSVIMCARLIHCPLAYTPNRLHTAPGPFSSVQQSLFGHCKRCTSLLMARTFYWIQRLSRLESNEQDVAIIYCNGM